MALPLDEQSGGDEGLEAYSPAVRGGRPKRASAAPAQSAPSPTAGSAPKAEGLREAFSGLRVSLMPSELEGKAPPDLNRGLLVLALVLIVETLVIGTGYFFVSRALNTRLDERKVLQDKITGLDATVSEQEKLAKDAAAYNGQISAAKEALDRHVYWSKFYALLEAKTRPTVKYLNFSGDADSGIVTLDAVGRSYRDVAEQIVALREEPLIADVRTTSAAAKITETGEITGVSFTMVIKFNAEAWTRKASETKAAGAATSNGSARSVTAGTAGTKDCGTATAGIRDSQVAQLECTKGSFKDCLPTKSTYVTEDQEIYTEIKGFDGSGRCLVHQKYVKDDDAEFQGKEMTCALVPGEFVSIAFANAASEGFKDCTGSLVAVYLKDSSR